MRVTIERDTDAESPRSWDSLGTMFCRHRRYHLGDRAARDISEIDEAVAVKLPLYLYDHSGITMATTPFSCPWDSGRVGVIYLTVERLIAEYGEDTPETRKRAEAVLQSEVEVYDQYLRGEVYGYVIETEDGEAIDSCWGFYGDNPATNGMFDCITDPKQQAALLAAAGR